MNDDQSTTDFGDNKFPYYKGEQVKNFRDNLTKKITMMNPIFNSMAMLMEKLLKH